MKYLEYDFIQGFFKETLSTRVWECNRLCSMYAFGKAVQNCLCEGMCVRVVGFSCVYACVKEREEETETKTETEREIVKQRDRET